MNDYLRHVRMYRILKALLQGVLLRYFRMDAQQVTPPPGPCLIVANHNMDLDPVAVALSFPDHMYFVASEHILRKGFASKLLKRYLAPIARIKGATDAQAAMDIIRTLRRGVNVCLFAEGNRSFNGVTGEIFPATGKLAKASAASLITYRLEGGYLSTPRWGHTRRWGPTRGSLVRVYSPAELKEMKPEQVNDAIRRDLYEDAFERQKTQMAPYRGKKRAEYLEAALYRCPRCDAVDAMHSQDDRFCCDCGLSMTYNEYGFFEGEDLPFTTVRDWDAWQEQRLHTLVQQEGGVRFSDTGVTLCRVQSGKKNEPMTTGTLSMDQQTLSVGEMSFTLAEISDLAVYARANLIFTVGGEHYECKNAHPWCARKYMSLYRCCHS